MFNSYNENKDMKTKNIFRMLLVAAALLMGANNVKATETQLWPAPTDGDNAYADVSNLYISGDTFTSLQDGDVLRINLNGNTNNQIQIFKGDWSGSFYFSQSFGNTIDLDVDATLRANLSNGIYIQGQGFTLKNIIRIVNPPLATGENIVAENLGWCNNWGQDKKVLSIAKFKKAHAGDKVRIYGQFNNGWAAEFWGLGSDESYISVPISEWWIEAQEKYQANGNNVTTPSYGGYIEFELTSTNLPIIQAASQCLIQGQQFEIFRVVIYVAESGGTELSDPGLAYEQANKTATYGVAFTKQALTNPNDLTVTYSSSVPAVATVNESTGDVTILKSGTTVITATFVGNSTYRSGSAQYTLTVNRGTATLSFQKESESVTVGNTVSSPGLTTTPSGLSVTYSSSDSGVASVDQNSGVVTGVAEGTATITATFAQNDYYNQATASYTITVNAAPAQEPVTDNWTASSTAPGANTELKNDDAVIISTVYATTVKNDTKTIHGRTFNQCINVRVNAAPSAENVNGTEESGSTPIVIEAEQDVTVVFYYRRQNDGGDTPWSYTNDNSKDLKLIDQGAPTTLVTGSLSVNNAEQSGSNEFGYVCKTYNLTAGHTYTVWATGTTIQLYGIYYSTEASNVQVNQTYKITYMNGSDIYTACWYASGAVIQPLDTTPTKDGYTFSGWKDSSSNDIPQGMPANDITVYAQFTQDAPSESDYIDIDDGNIGYYGYRTYVTTQAIDFSRSKGVEAYYATGLNSDNTKVEFTEVTGICAAEVPLLLKKKTGATEYKLLKSTSTGTTPTGNKLHAGDGDYVGGNGTRGYYVLTWHNNKPVFAETNINAAKVDNEHAYLYVSGGNGSRLRISFKHDDDDLTGIQSLQSDERSLDGAVYNLRGQRVEHPTKGIYIINGKKVVIK